MVLHASAETLKQRLAGRARDDDHDAAVEKRLQTWHEQSAEVVEYYREEGKLVPVNAEGQKGEVLKEMERQLTDKVQVVGFFLLGRGRSKSAGEEDVKEGTENGSL